MDTCIFCKIINKEIPKEFDYESENLVVFPDINPAAQVHLLIVPKRHIRAITEIKQDMGGLLVEVYQAAKVQVEKNNLSQRYYRVVVNGGRTQHVPHLHFHLLCGQWKKFI
jgi:histidine triad (HIT) family protein